MDTPRVPPDPGQDPLHRSTRRGRDLGVSLVEILIAVTLLGIAVTATVGALQTTIVATAIERDHAKAYQWLQSATGVIKATERLSCDTNDEATIRASYESVLRSTVIGPADWADANLSIAAPIKFWDGSEYWSPSTDANVRTCFESDGFTLQLITLRVTSPNGRIVETLEVVKRG